MLPSGRALIPYYDEDKFSTLVSDDGGATWTTQLGIAPANYVTHANLRAAPLPTSTVSSDGRAYLASNTHATSRLQLGVEPWERGRIMALWSVAFLGLRPFASIVDGVIANTFGVRYAGAMLALPALACAGWMVVRARTRGWGAARVELPPET